MPLIKSSSEAAFKNNVAEMRLAGHPIKQALAASYDNQRRAKASGHAKGGAPAPIPGSTPGANIPGIPSGMTIGAGSPNQIHMNGLIHGPGNGRSDSIRMHVPKGGYMVPADIVSGIGHGSSLAGARALDHSFPMDIRTPEGRAHVRGFAPLMKRPFGTAFSTKSFAKFAQGGDPDLTEILGSEGEYFIHPHAIQGRFGSLKKGHMVLDHWVQERRRKNIKDQRKLKPPKGAKKI